MATAVAQTGIPAKPLTRTPGRRFDHFFFSGMAWLMMATVFAGFAHTYYLAGMFHAPLPSLIVHLHGAAFSCWILLLIAQTTLASAGRIVIHRRLGIAGFLLACLMVILGVLVATEALVRGAGPPSRDVKFFYIIPLSNILAFGTLVFFAFRARFNPPAHKRLILVATTALMVAAIARWPIAMIHGKAPIAMFASYAFLLALVAYDLWSTHKIQRATLWAGAFLIFVEQMSIPIGKTAAWHAFASWVQSAAR
jgi:hypothetical protein